MPEQRKHERSHKSQLGQFFTPEPLAEELLYDLPMTQESKVLEPGCGNGSFVCALLHKFDKLYTTNHRLNSIDRFVKVFEDNLWAVELDARHFTQMQHRIEQWYRIKRRNLSFASPNLKHHLAHDDFLMHDFGDTKFDFIVGNPPFGGTIAYENQNHLDRLYGKRNGWKIKKETYSFFLVKCLDLLNPGGTIRFICSDTFLTIKTMSGLRRLLMEHGESDIKRLDYFSEETDYPMVVFTFKKNGPASSIWLDGAELQKATMDLTGNFSWTVTEDASDYFSGPKLSDYVICTSGMTTGKNEYFVRDLNPDNTFEEPFKFEFFDDPITVKREIERARLNKLSDAKIAQVSQQEANGETRRNVSITPREQPLLWSWPHEHYAFYNKASSGSFFEKPKHVIYWKDDGDAVLTYKKNANWYLHGVGGKPYFGREGMTWALIASSIKMRYLPAGYILDSGAPCAFLLEGVPQDELYFILGWCNTRLASTILKKYINHTKNIQSKDIERLPYPVWVNPVAKAQAIDLVKKIAAEAMNNEPPSKSDLDLLESFYLKRCQSGHQMLEKPQYEVETPSLVT